MSHPIRSFQRCGLGGVFDTFQAAINDSGTTSSVTGKDVLGFTSGILQTLGQTAAAIVPSFVKTAAPTHQVTANQNGTYTTQPYTPPQARSSVPAWVYLLGAGAVVAGGAMLLRRR